MAARRVTLLVQSQFLAKHFVSFSEVIKIILVKSSLRYVRFNPCMVRFRSHLIDIYLCGNVSNLYGNVSSMVDVLGKEMQSVILFCITDHLLCKDITITRAAVKEKNPLDHPV